MTDKRNRIAQPISFTPAHIKAITWLAQEQGGNSKSGVLRLLIESAMRERFGANWLEVIERDEAEARELVVA
jgi:hypothetical protein